MLTLKDPGLSRQAALIGDQWVEADSATGIAVKNPATGELLGYVPNLGAAETDVTAAMAVATEETFGPVAPLFRFTKKSDVVAAANASEFGLASCFYSEDLSRVWRVGEALDYGMVGVNTGLVSTVEAPFGGVKSSGLGREGSHYGLDEFFELKYLCLGGIEADNT